MNKLLLLLVPAAFIFSGCDQCCQPERAQAIKQTRSDMVLRHVVLFSFNEGTTDAQLREVENAFRVLPSKIPEILDFEWGTDVSVENHQKGFTHCFFVTFKDEKARAAYLPHPEHKAFGQVLRKYMKDVLVIDYWAQQ